MEPSAGNLTRSSDSAPLEPTAARLERISRAGITILNNHDFELKSKEAQELLAHLSLKYRARLDAAGGPLRPLTFEEQVAQWSQRAQEHPDVHFEILDVSSTVDEEKGEASVYMTMEVTGLGSVSLHAMNELSWKREHGEWKCYHVVGLRGSFGNMGGPMPG